MTGFAPRERVGVVVLTDLASTPLRDALLFESIDRVLGLDDHDWNARFRHIADPLVAARALSKATTTAEQVAGAPFTHPLTDFAGRFEHPSYPSIEVAVDSEALRARLVGILDWTLLIHQHYCRISHEVVGFRIDRQRFDFERSGGIVERLVFLD